ncbi:MAG: xanthine dehydrogenase accessory protein XdhC [Betaproteobacteria bacterium]|nr:xanthine dehydrogenase accessory protein XdhC [Betaproteobacteria bacterium]
MNAEWIDALPRWLAAGPVALVTVAHVEGSAPREAGAAFLVSGNDTLGTIGGGHLEFEAIRHARDMLDATSPIALKRYALGPSLGQCCGGVVWLLFEVIAPAERDTWARRLAQWRNGLPIQRSARSVVASSRWAPSRDTPRVEFHLQGEAWDFEQVLRREAFPIFVFGAGHVGEAIVHALAPVSSEIVWIDSREDAFPAGRPAGVETQWTDDPASEVAYAPPGTWFLVLTHSHDLDLAICTAILERNDFAFFGLIGSKSKRARFAARLAARGLDTGRMTCPIGLPGIPGKAPATIAVAVAAQLLQLREARPAHHPADALELHG